MSQSVLSAGAKLGIGAEATLGAYTVPSFTVPFEAGTRYRSAITQLTDMTVRARDTDTQDIQQGPSWSDWTITTEAYADWAGWLCRAMVGPDQFTAGVVTTFASGAAPGARSVSLAASPPAGAVLQLGAGASLEYAQAGTPTGSGPYTVPITTPASGLIYPHTAGDPARSQAAHIFQQNRTIATVWPSYSLTSDDGVDSLGWPYCVLGRIRLQVQADGYAHLVSTWNGWPPSAVATFTEAQTSAQPPAGWTWAITTAGGASTRGVTLDLALTRELDIVTACNGYQAPLLIAPGPMRVSGQYKAIYDTAADLNLYRAAIQEPAVWTLTQPVLQGGSSIAVTLSLSGWTAGEVSLEEQYVSASYSLSGIANPADSPQYGVSSVKVMNWWNQSY